MCATALLLRHSCGKKTSLPSAKDAPGTVGLLQLLLAAIIVDVCCCCCCCCCCHLGVSSTGNDWCFWISGMIEVWDLAK